MSESTIMDVQGRVMFSGSENQTVLWLAKRTPQDEPAVYARINKTGRVLPVADFLSYVEACGQQKSTDHDVAMNEICSILTAFADVSATGVLNEEELSRVRSTAAGQIIALFEGE